MRLEKVEAALDWAYRRGYCYAKEAAEQYAASTMTRAVKEDLGAYDGLSFISIANPDATKREPI
jgi:hypothetical protein